MDQQIDLSVGTERGGILALISLCRRCPSGALFPPTVQQEIRDAVRSLIPDMPSVHGAVELSGARSLVWCEGGHPDWIDPCVDVQMRIRTSGPVDAVTLGVVIAEVEIKLMRCLGDGTALDLTERESQT